MGLPHRRGRPDSRLDGAEPEQQCLPGGAEALMDECERAWRARSCFCLRQAPSRLRASKRATVGASLYRLPLPISMHLTIGRGISDLWLFGESLSVQCIMPCKPMQAHMSLDFALGWVARALFVQS